MMERFLRLSVGVESQDLMRRSFELRARGTVNSLREAAGLFQEAAGVTTSLMGRMVCLAHAAACVEAAGDYELHASLVERAVDACTAMPRDLSCLLTSLLRGPDAPTFQH